MFQIPNRRRKVNEQTPNLHLFCTNTSKQIQLTSAEFMLISPHITPEHNAY